MSLLIQNWPEFIKHNTLSVVQAGGAQRACLSVLRWIDGSEVVLKDFSCSVWLYRHTLGRLILWNEARVYRLIKDIMGVPRLVARPRMDCLVTERVVGRPLHMIAPGDKELSFSIVEQAREILEQLHNRGISHGDLGHDADGCLGRDANVLWGDGKLYIVDFASAVERRFVPASMFDALCLYDRMLITKLLRRYFPERRREPEFNLHLELSVVQKRWLKCLCK